MKYIVFFFSLALTSFILLLIVMWHVSPKRSKKAIDSFIDRIDDAGYNPFKLID